MKYLSLTAITVNLFLLTSCASTLGRSEMAYNMQSIDINGIEYPCWNVPGVDITADKIMNALCQVTKFEQDYCLKKLKETPVGICELPPFIEYEYCGTVLVKGGCYYGYQKQIFLISDALVHELIHHVINVVYDTSEDYRLSGIHEHPLFDYESMFRGVFKNETSRPW